MPDGHILWTHVTSPFISSDIYSQVIEKYLENLDNFDLGKYSGRIGNAQALFDAAVSKGFGVAEFQRQKNKI